MLLHLGVDSSTWIFKVGIEKPHQGGKYISRYFKDEVSQTDHNESFNKVSLFEEILIRVGRFKDLSIDVVAIEFFSFS